MDVDKIIELTQTLELSVDEFYKTEEEKLEELKNMPYAVAKESYVTTKKIIDNKDDTYTLIGDLKTRLKEVKEIDKVRTRKLEISSVQDIIESEMPSRSKYDSKETEENDDESTSDTLKAIRVYENKPRLRRFLLSDSSVARLNRNGMEFIVPLNSDLEELEEFDDDIENDIDNDMDAIERIKAELELEKVVEQEETYFEEEDVEEQEADEDYYGFIDATALLETIDKKREENLDFSKTLYMDKPHFAPKIRAIGIPDEQLMSLIDSRNDNLTILEELNEKCQKNSKPEQRREEHDSTDVFTNSFDEAFKKALDTEKRKVDKNKISDREKALRELSQME